MRQRCRHHRRPVPRRPAAPVHELQLLAGLGGEESREKEADVVLGGGRRRRSGGGGHGWKRLEMWRGENRP